MLSRAGGRDREAECPRRGGVAHLRGRPRRPGSVHRLLRAWTGGRRARSGGYGTGGIRTGRRPRSAGGRAAGVREFGLARGLLPRWHDTRVGRAVVARRERAGTRAGPLDPCTPCRGAGDARPLRRGARAPHRITCDAGRPRRGTLLAGLTRVSGEVELLADDPAAAAELGTEACRLFAELGEKGYLSTAAGNLAQALYAGRSAGGSGGLGRPRSGARRQRRRRDRSALAPSQGEGARTSGRARRGRAVGT